MRSTFSGLELARRALQTQQVALNTVGHNIANANTKGYSRQEVITSATGPYTSPSNIRPMKAGQIGTGVSVVAIQRQFDKYTANQWRLENSLLAQWQQKKLGMEQIEAIFNEPSEGSVRKAVDEFWSALQQLAIEPTELSSRALVRQAGVTMVDAFKTMDRQLEQVDRDYDELLKGAVAEINSLLNQITDINRRIVKVTAMGDYPNDLLDQRDLMLDKLTELINVDMEENSRGDLKLTFAGVTLVDFVGVGTEVARFKEEGGEIILGENINVFEHILHGKVKGILDAKGAVKRYRDHLAEYALGYVKAINEQHQQGFDLNGDSGLDFFVFDGEESIKNLKVNPEIMNDLTKIAAGTTQNLGDGSNAVKMAELRHQGNLEYAGKEVTYDQYYRAVIADLGIETNETIQMTENQRTLAQQFELRQEVFRGVSLDEEMTKMVQYQHSYAAAARLTTTVDEMIDLIVNRLGIVGR
ncbi:flagellar hook-associated protein 1 FlgK [Anaerobranca californiensis DSM 14826]|jgi:flagellar hook-associated protein 1 FlgK|uniref:Flagellar hook-associated protein 1 n=1 Tax=Anaerobranca californiensis DSM 14826 TaxID=1120989 RepID=A0A1M6Q1Y1_9FIRM|nr:flagellar hook-associated protein FlgK [Anaerobranca californiensis]SHK14194.1 flagellar hook-associated protein 1 FlgK [Anaerobranca californiensis DSM 14826]